MAFTNILQDEILIPLRSALLKEFKEGSLYVGFDKEFTQHGSQWLNILPVNAALVGDTGSGMNTYTYSLRLRLYVMGIGLGSYEINDPALEVLERIKYTIIESRHDATNWVYATVISIDYEPDVDDKESDIQGLRVLEMNVEITNSEVV